MTVGLVEPHAATVVTELASVKVAAIPSFAPGYKPSLQATQVAALTAVPLYLAQPVTKVAVTVPQLLSPSKIYGGVHIVHTWEVLYVAQLVFALAVSTLAHPPVF